MVVFDHRWFSFVPNPCLPVWVCPMISLKARLTLTFLMVFLTFHFFPLYKVRFNDFISLLFDLSKTIWSLIFPDLKIKIERNWENTGKSIFFLYSLNLSLFSKNYYEVDFIKIWSACNIHSFENRIRSACNIHSFENRIRSACNIHSFENRIRSACNIHSFENRIRSACNIHSFENKISTLAFTKGVIIRF